MYDLISLFKRDLCSLMFAYFALREIQYFNVKIDIKILH